MTSTRIGTGAQSLADVCSILLGSNNLHFSVSICTESALIMIPEDLSKVFRLKIGTELCKERED